MSAVNYAVFFFYYSGPHITNESIEHARRIGCNGLGAHGLQWGATKRVWNPATGLVRQETQFTLKMKRDVFFCVFPLKFCHRLRSAISERWVVGPFFISMFSRFRIVKKKLKYSLACIFRNKKSGKKSLRVCSSKRCEISGYKSQKWACRFVCTKIQNRSI